MGFAFSRLLLYIMEAKAAAEQQGWLSVERVSESKPLGCQNLWVVCV